MERSLIEAERQVSETEQSVSGAKRFKMLSTERFVTSISHSMSTTEQSVYSRE